MTCCESTRTNGDSSPETEWVEKHQTAERKTQLPLVRVVVKDRGIRVPVFALTNRHYPGAHVNAATAWRRPNGLIQQVKRSKRKNIKSSRLKACLDFKCRFWTSKNPLRNKKRNRISRSADRLVPSPLTPADTTHPHPQEPARSHRRSWESAASLSSTK